MTTIHDLTKMKKIFIILLFIVIGLGLLLYDTLKYNISSVSYLSESVNFSNSVHLSYGDNIFLLSSDGFIYDVSFISAKKNQAFVLVKKYHDGNLVCENSKRFYSYQFVLRTGLKTTRSFPLKQNTRSNICGLNVMWTPVLNSLIFKNDLNFIFPNLMMIIL